MAIDAKAKIIVALDVATKGEALALVEQLRGVVSFFKIGLQLYTTEGPAMVRIVRDTGAKVFLDLKLHDIPNTVAHSVKSAAKLDVQMLTIHLSGGRDMIRAAVEAGGKQIHIMGVTALTSHTEQTLREIGISDRMNEHVLRLARLGASERIDGLIASPFEVRALRTELGDQVRLVTPGVRPEGSAADDQKRFMTPREAIRAGADYLVIGRPITADPSPASALARILAELA